MKKFFRWLFYVLAGAALGYGAGLLIGTNVYLSMAIGILLGSSAAVTINIQISKDEYHYRTIDEDLGEEYSEEEEPTIPQKDRASS